MKKANAYLSIIIIVLLVVHAGYESAAFCLMYYNPLLSKITGYLIAGTITVHAVISMICLFVLHDSGSVIYIRLNMRTVIQRVCAILIIVLLPVHILAFDILGRTAGSFLYVLTETSQAVFYAAVFTHVAVSFEKSLISLGKLENEVVRRRLNKIVAVICFLMFVSTNVITITTHVKMFFPDR
ncbi:MAG: hypothetical protein K5668_01090 [Lachnospiraceae bacterium]|nr:hypothetical protein [Lachnospiraceae bacterium]